MPRPGGVPANLTCSPHSLGTVRAGPQHAAQDDGLGSKRLGAFGRCTRSGGHGGEAAGERLAVLDELADRVGVQQLRVAERGGYGAALLGDGVEARLHVVGALSAGLERVDAHHLVLAEADGERLARVAALEVAFGGRRRLEGVDGLGVVQEVRNGRQRRHGRGRLHLGDDLGDVGGKLRPRVFRRLLGDVVVGVVGLPEHALGLARLALGFDAGASRSCGAVRGCRGPCASRRRSCAARA